MQEILRRVYVADTPYQIFVCICDSMASNKGCDDLVIYGQFADAKEMADKIRKANLFNAVYYVPTYYASGRMKNIKYYLITFLLNKFSVHKLRSLCTEIPISYYDVLLFCCGSPFVHDIKLVCCKQGVTSILLEDGSGLYNYAVINDMAFLDRIEGLDASENSLRKIIKTLINRCTNNRFLMNVKEVHGFRIECLKNMYPRVSISGIAVDDSAMGTIQTIFGDDGLFASGKIRYIFFTLSDDVPIDVLLLEKKILDILASYCGSELAIRLHPCFTLLDCLIGGDNVGEEMIVSKGGLWEAHCLGGDISEKTVLIGFGSTAQTTPRELSAIEPYVIFLPLLLPNNYHSRKSLEKVAMSYFADAVDKDRIFIPKEIDEFHEVLKRLVKND